jgi:adenylate kinase family enzyme
MRIDVTGNAGAGKTTLAREIVEAKVRGVGPTARAG